MNGFNIVNINFSALQLKYLSDAITVVRKTIDLENDEDITLSYQTYNGNIEYETFQISFKNNAICYIDLLEMEISYTDFGANLMQKYIITK